MAFAAYLDPAEYAAYGIPNASSAQVESACRVVNAHLSRPEGLLWSPDARGAPAYMTNKGASRSIQLLAPIAPGTNVAVDVPGQKFGPQTVGEVVILDRADANKVEACVISAASGPTLTLASVQFTHSAQVVMEFGLTIFQELPIPARRATVRLSRTPVVQILSGFGRYAVGRRSQQFAGQDMSLDLLGIAAAFGGPPAWVPFPVEHADVSVQTGEVWIPPGLLLSQFSDVRLHYVAGWPKEGVPGDIKQAVANIAVAAINSPFDANVKLMKAGDATLERFSPSAIDKDTQALLQPYKAIVMA